MTLSVIPYLAKGKIEAQRVLVSVFDKPVGELLVNRSGKYKVVIPKALIIDQKLNITFELPDSRNPLAMNASLDTRELGIALSSLQLEVTTSDIADIPLTISDGEKIYFGKGGSAVLYMQQGWSAPESSYTWTNSRNATLALPLIDSGQDVKLSVRLRPFIVKEILEEQVVSISANEQVVGQWVVGERGLYELLISQNNMVDGLLNLSFELPSAQSPAVLGTGPDQRLLGVSVESIQLDFVP
jgi:hypothetical protein